jgi:hypothetical protein
MTEQSETPRASSTTSEADADNTSPSAAPDDATLAGIRDEQLPEDLQPGEDNPLAEPLDPDAEATKDPDELGMDDTQDDTRGHYRSEGELGDSDSPGQGDSDASDDSDASGA